MLSPELREYLTRCGLSEGQIAQCSRSTRMYHDLGLYGDIAEAYIEALVDHYQVDLSGFRFEKFFPPEFVGENLFTRTLLWLVPFAARIARQRGDYLPLTLGTIEHVMRTKRWEPMQ